jgi:hypothetical protein
VTAWVIEKNAAAGCVNSCHAPTTHNVIKILSATHKAADVVLCHHAQVMPHVVMDSHAHKALASQIVRFVVSAPHPHNVVLVVHVSTSTKMGLVNASLNAKHPQAFALGIQSVTKCQSKATRTFFA